MPDQVISSHELRDQLSKLPPPEKYFMRKHPTLDAYLGGLEGGEIITIAAMPGAGKCHGKGTLVLMSDCSLKKVENVVVGDKLMGDDSHARRVIALGKGVDEMYKVVPNKGAPFTVNGEHILCLKHTYTKRIKEVSLKDFLKLGKFSREKWKLYKVGLDFASKNVSLDPYFLGLWLGDGTACKTEITTGDKEIVDFLGRFSASLNLTCTIKSNSKNSVRIDLVNQHRCVNRLRNSLRTIGVWRNKHIPKEFLLNSRNIRLELLAGLIDSDGYVGGKSKSSGFGFCNKNQRLFDDFVFLCRSLGFSVSTRLKHNRKYNRDYFVANVSGDCSVIPSILPRKRRAKRRMNKDALVTGFKIEHIGRGEYYGFQISGNGRYLLHDFIVTHNTSFAVSLTKDLSQSYPCMWFSCEMAPRAFLNMFGLEVPLFYLPEEVRQFNSVQPTLLWLLGMIQTAKKERGCKIVFLDHLQYLSNLTADKSTQMVDYIMRFLKNMCVTEDIVLFLISHIDKDSGKEEKRPSITSMRGSQMIAGESSTVIIVQRLKDKTKDSYGEHPWSLNTRFYVDKNRRNGTLGYVTMEYDPTNRIFKEPESMETA